MALPIGTLSHYQERGLEKIGVGSLEALKDVAENVFAVFGQTPDGRPVTLPRRMTRDELRGLRMAAAALIRILARLEEDE
jgi:hypothetical protein